MKLANVFSKSFTLVELLVCLSIFAILLNLLIPSLKKVMTKSEALVCMNNLRTISSAFIAYEEDERYLPYCQDNRLPGNINSNFKRKNAPIPSFFEYNKLSDMEWNNVDGQRKSTVFDCPSASCYSDGSPNYGDYVGNANILYTDFLSSYGAKHKSYYRSTDISSPGEIIMIAEKSFTTVYDYHFDEAGWYRKNGVAGEYLIEWLHGSQSNMLFVDGHSAAQFKFDTSDAQIVVPPH
jgi:prepilin-type processing-associated H-X9-DG protein/prepilin-type N-terminal cleavage/methylation domain-containing protein